MKNPTIDAIEQKLAPYVQIAGKLQGRDITTGRTLALSNHVGSPHQRLRVIHVAGTSGKTSTSYYIAALLSKAGVRVGLTVSPHMDSITERVQLGGEPMPNAEFSVEMQEFLDLIESYPDKPTYFELMMVFALWVFDRRDVEYAVVETGLGGLHDSSNICTRSDKVAVITDIGLDHMHVLGNTLTEIAGQKLGIVHQGNAIITHPQNDEVMTQIHRTADVNSSSLILATSNLAESNLAKFQRRNWSLALEVYDYIANRDGLAELSRQQLLETQQEKVPGRMDVYQLDGKTIVIDGAHNEQKLTALMSSFQEMYPNSEPIVIVAVKQGKDIEQMGPILASLSKHIIVTDIEITQDIPHQSIPTNTIKQILSQYSEGIDIQEIPSNAKALDKSLAQSNSTILVVGSLYLASTMRQLVKDKLQ